MLGLLYKDLCMIRKSGFITILLLVAVLLFIMWVPYDKMETELDMQLVALMVFFGSMWGLISIFRIIMEPDEKKVWHGFVMASPVGYKQYILAKYFFSLTALWMVVAICILGELIGMLIPGTVKAFSSLSITIFFIGIIYQALEAPFIFRFGTKYAGKFKVVFILVLFYFFMAYILFGKVPDTYVMFDYLVKLSRDEVALSMIGQTVVTLLPYIAMGSYYLSYKVSCRWYLKRGDTYEA